MIDCALWWLQQLMVDAFGVQSSAFYTLLLLFLTVKQ